MAEVRNLLALDNMEVVAFNSLQVTNQQSIGSTVRNISSKQVTWCGFILHNNDASNATWVQVFLKPSGDVVLGTTAPDFTIKIVAGASVAWDFLNPIRQGTGLSIASTTTETGSTAPATLTTGSILYKKPL